MLNRLVRGGTHPLRIASLFFAALGLCAAVYIAQVPAARPALPLAELPALAVGDWVLRSGTSTESQLIQTLSNSEFSHIGMVVSLQPEPVIVHATTDDEPQRANQVLSTQLSDFIDPKLAHNFAIVRPRFLSAQDNQLAAQQLLQHVGQPFVLAARDSEHRYCTTLLVDALQHAGIAFQPQWQQINAPLLSGEYLFPSAFANYPDIEWLYHSATAQ